MKNVNLVISTQTLATTLMIGIFVWLLLLIKSVIIALFIAMILALGIEPFVVWIVSHKIPRGIAVLIVVICFLTFLLSLGSIVISPLFLQLNLLSNQFPKYLDKFGEIIKRPGFTNDFNSALIKQFSQTTGNVLSATIGAFSGVFTILTVIIFTAYILLDFDNLRKLFVNSFPSHRQKEITLLTSRIENKLGGWLRGEAVLMIIVGTATYLGLLAIGIESALALAVIAGLLEIVPIIGPILSVIPALIIGLVMNPLTGLAVLGLYVLVQQLENNILVPKIMQKSIGFNPLVTIVALLIGGKLLGIIGALIAIPVTIVLAEVVKYILHLEGYYFTKSPRTAG